LSLGQTLKDAMNDLGLNRMQFLAFWSVNDDQFDREVGSVGSARAARPPS
jgi:hypothetical protein